MEDNDKRREFSIFNFFFLSLLLCYLLRKIMARIISQETFDDAVKENMEDFDMNREDAILDSIAQFTAQGVDLSNIVKTAVTEEHPVVAAMANLRKAGENLEAAGSGAGEAEKEAVIAGLEALKAACEKDDESRTIAASRGAMSLVLPHSSLDRVAVDQRKVQLAGLRALAALCTDCPACQDALRVAQKDGLAALLSQALETGDNEFAVAVSNLIRTACRKNEKNRATFVEGGVTAPLLACIKKGAVGASPSEQELALAACTATRVLTFDDDMRADFGTAHVNAKRLVEEGGIPILLGMLAASHDAASAPAAASACSTLSRLVVKDEFCKEAVEGGALGFATGLLQSLGENKEVAAQACALMKALAGNDDTKARICQTDAIKVVLQAMAVHPSSAPVQENGCALLAAVVLRLPENARILVELGIIDILMEAMKNHSTSIRVQRQACMAIRNCVVRCDDLKPKFRLAGFEPLIRFAMEKYPDRCQDVGHAALRDLECENVEFKELWKGAVKGKQWDEGASTLADD